MADINNTKFFTTGLFGSSKDTNDVWKRKCFNKIGEAFFCPYVTYQINITGQSFSF
jgi:hypothetical protein